jgi:hypothetical protein
VKSRKQKKRRIKNPIPNAYPISKIGTTADPKGRNGISLHMKNTLVKKKNKYSFCTVKYHNHKNKNINKEVKQ